MDISILLPLACFLYLVPYTKAEYPNITHAEPIHNEVTKFGHRICIEGDVYKRPDNILKCCYKKGGRLACQEIECDDDGTSVIEDVKTELEPMPRKNGRICMPDGIIFRGKNNLLYCCDGPDTQRLCTRILCPQSDSAYNEETYDLSESQHRISRKINEISYHHRGEPPKYSAPKRVEVAPLQAYPSSSKHDDFFGYLQ